jgi:hypothetical protein
MDQGAREGVRSVRDRTSAAPSGAQSGSGVLMVLVAGLFAGSALVSLTLLWFVIRGIQWLLHG